MSGPTPGPWEAWLAPTGEAVVRRVYRDKQNRRVTEWPAVCNCNTLDNMANAHLIAAAPDLLAVAQMVAKASDLAGLHGPIGVAARAAIVRATPHASGQPGEN